MRYERFPFCVAFGVALTMDRGGWASIGGSSIGGSSIGGAWRYLRTSGSADAAAAAPWTVCEIVGYAYRVDYGGIRGSLCNSIDEEKKINILK